MDWLFGFNFKCKLPVILANGIVWGEGTKTKWSINVWAKRLSLQQSCIPVRS